MTKDHQNRKNILILEPEPDVGELFARALETHRDCKCYLASSENEAMDLIKDISFGLVLVDIGVAMASDFSLLRRIKRALPGMPVVVDAYLHQREQVHRALALGADNYIIKPIKVDSFRKKMDEFHISASPLLT
jgi:DNA-binding response OmpR family regulator